jgi:hypothetical protein
MADIVFNTVWYLPSENTWGNFNPLAFRDAGRLMVRADSLEFVGSKNHVLVEGIRRVTIGKQGRDFVNQWVKVDYGKDSQAFFADGGWLGWGGLIGGTQKIYAALYRFNQP